MRLLFPEEARRKLKLVDLPAKSGRVPTNFTGIRNLVCLSEVYQHCIDKFKGKTTRTTTLFSTLVITPSLKQWRNCCHQHFLVASIGIACRCSAETIPPSTYNFDKMRKTLVDRLNVLESSGT
jgi:hypothetical protein